jgi:hypothetical protein
MGPGGFRRGRRRGLVVGAAVGASVARNNARRNDAAQEADAEQVQADQPAPTQDKFQQLEQLGKLKEQGILTEAEFEAQKAIILNS